MLLNFLLAYVHLTEEGAIREDKDKMLRKSAARKGGTD